MFASLLRKQKDPRSESETTPLLAALHRYRSRRAHDDHAASDDDDHDHDYHEDIAHYDAGDEDDDQNARRRDGPLLPVFSSEFLGVYNLPLRISCNARGLFTPTKDLR